MEAVVVTQDHKPNLEQERGAARLAQQELYWEEGVAYLTTQPHDGLEVQRLALSRALGDYDLTGKDTHFSSTQFGRMPSVQVHHSSFFGFWCVRTKQHGCDGSRMRLM